MVFKIVVKITFNGNIRLKMKSYYCNISINEERNNDNYEIFLETGKRVLFKCH